MFVPNRERERADGHCVEGILTGTDLNANGHGSHEIDYCCGSGAGISLRVMRSVASSFTVTLTLLL